MNRKLRKRIIGAIVLAAFLVIFVPEWLDGAGHKALYSKNVSIPEKPEIKPISEYVEVAVAKSAEDVEKTESAEEARPVEKIKSVEKTKPAKETKPVAIVAKKNRNTKKGVVSKEEVLVDAWALQLGSFSNESNAEVMRDKLRKKGYTSYVHEVKQSGKVIYRVRIGPELDRQQLEKIKAKLLKKEKMEGLIVKHP